MLHGTQTTWHILGSCQNLYTYSTGQKKKKKEEEIKNFKSAKKSQNKYENRVWVIIYQKRETT